ncbi:MAG: hypothetical protein Aurels2KO_28180 [Aureliella sp.]
MHEYLDPNNVKTLSDSIDITIRGCDKVEQLDCENRAALLVGDISEAECDQMELVIRRLVQGLVPTVQCILLTIEITELFEGDERIAKLKDRFDYLSSQI